MSLQIWLPFNGDLHNQGLSNIQFTNNEATVDTSGKIGKCYSFNGSSSYLKATYNFYNNKYSMCTWIYSTSSSATQTICCDRTAVGSGLSIFLISGKLRIDPGGNNIQWSTGYTYPINTWFHLAITYDGIYTSYYINGEFKGKQEATISSSYWGNTTSIGASQSNNSSYANYLNGKLNDFRIYDHCLSQKEVEELAKGLVLHYKMDNNDSGIIYDCSGYHNDATIIGTSTLVASPKYSYGLYMNNTSTANRIESNNALNLSTTGPITVSFWAKFDTSVGQVLFAIPSTLECASNTTSYIWVNPTASQAGFSLTGFNNNDWNHIVIMRDGSNFYVYINGESVSRNGSNNNWTHNGTKMYLFNRNANNNYAANASISDFRIYATILTEAQIKELYNTSVTIDKDGNVYTREAIEQTNSLSINKQGQFIVNEVKDSDVTIASILKSTKTISSNNFYEY